MALLLALVLTPVVHPFAPHRAVQLIGMVAFVPVARILMAANPHTSAGVFIGIGVLMFVDRVAMALASLPAASLQIRLAELAFAMALAATYLRNTPAQDRRGWRARLAQLVGAGAVVSGLAEVGGWSQLAELVGRAVIAGGISSLFFYTAAISLEALFAQALASPALRNSHFVDRNQELVQRWSSILIRLVTALLWLRLTLATLGLREVAGDAMRRVLAIGITVGALSLSIGGLLAFLSTLVVAMVVSRIVHEILEDELFPRMSLPRGIPDVLLALTTYAVYALGFLFALAAAGVQLGQLAILMGGLGVGIGLGLQDLVKNFAAGITLLIERRVHVGDAVQIPGKDVFGRVRTIGPRASVIRNWNGTEVVIPNDDLVSGTFTNWTLSDRLYRIDIPIAVPYGTDPNVVIPLLRSAAGADPHILSTPPPSASFKGFGDSGLDFVLRAWTDEEYEVVSARTSELALAVHAALAGAGIALRRDLPLATVASEPADGKPGPATIS
jgi:small-conductance mechanosensitive channel